MTECIETEFGYLVCAADFRNEWIKYSRDSLHNTEQYSVVLSGISDEKKETPRSDLVDQEICVKRFKNKNDAKDYAAYLLQEIKKSKEETNENNLY